jgi:hypothetical protein
MAPKDPIELSELFPGDVPCVKHWERTHDLVRKVAVIEERVSDIRDIKQAVHSVERHIEGMAQRLPQAEKAILELNKSFHDTSEKIELLKVETAGSKVRQGIMAAIMGALGGAAVVAVIQQTISHLVGG